MDVFGQSICRCRSEIFVLVLVHNDNTHARVLHAAIFLLIFPTFFYALTRRPFLYSRLGAGVDCCCRICENFSCYPPQPSPFVPLAMCFLWVFGIGKRGCFWQDARQRIIYIYTYIYMCIHTSYAGYSLLD